jgi:Domain of unknown function (DUF4160)
MSELSRFYGLIIRMYYDDHPPPHFHVQYGEYKAKITTDTLAVLTAYLPARALGLVVEWGLLPPRRVTGSMARCRESRRAFENRSSSVTDYRISGRKIRVPSASVSSVVRFVRREAKFAIIRVLRVFTASFPRKVFGKRERREGLPDQIEP